MLINQIGIVNSISTSVSCLSSVSNCGAVGEVPSVRNFFKHKHILELISLVRERVIVLVSLTPESFLYTISATDITKPMELLY